MMSLSILKLIFCLDSFQTLFFSGMPFPSPSLDMSGLTDDELREMEGTERKAVEARIQCLDNIKTLLDAAVMQMQQYSSIINNSQ